LLPEYAGKGFGKEAALATLHFGIEHLKMTIIFGITSPNNSISQKLLVSLGLKNRGIIVPPNEQEELLLFCLDVLA
jgi:RimJ/RimL family protein N-acetyltransferase